MYASSVDVIRLADGTVLYSFKPHGAAALLAVAINRLGQICGNKRQMKSDERDQT